LVKYYGQGFGQHAGEPLHTVTGRDTFGLVTVQGQQYTIADIGLRMLTPRELFNAQGFPPDYVIDTGPGGKPITKAAQVARCGNAVPPPFAEALVRANLPEMCGAKINTMSELQREMAV
jgi:DNA (cytosine-5)-methyltransferase 1